MMTPNAPDLRPYLGLPYRPGGDTRDGLDCYGLLRLVLREQCGLYLDDAEGVTGGEWRRVDTQHLWDAVLFNIAGQPAHCGIVIGGGAMLHIMEHATSCIESYTGLRWGSRLEGIYRHTRLSPHGGSNE